MSFLDWLSPKRKPERVPTVMPSSVLSRNETTRPYNPARQQALQAAAGARKQERTERRELLYLVVREAMVRAGVLSSRYKFKVLSLDTQGNQFLVMIDLAQGGRSTDTTRLSEIEVMIAQAAKARFDISVSAVYWRANEQVSVAPSRRGVVQQQAGTGEELVVSQAMPFTEPSTLPDELRSRFGDEPQAVQPAEMAALKKAMSASAKGEKALARVPESKRSKKSYTLLTGFEDTEMAAGDEDLSGTQYGELR